MMNGAAIKDERVRRHMTGRESIELRRHAARGARSVEAEPASVHVCADRMYMPAVRFLMRCLIGFSLLGFYLV